MESACLGHGLDCWLFPYQHLSLLSVHLVWVSLLLSPELSEELSWWQGQDRRPGSVLLFRSGVCADVIRSR